MGKGVRNLDRGIDLTKVWLKDTMDQLNYQSRSRAYQALRGYTACPERQASDSRCIPISQHSYLFH